MMIILIIILVFMIKKISNGNVNRIFKRQKIYWLLEGVRWSTTIFADYYDVACIWYICADQIDRGVQCLAAISVSAARPVRHICHCLVNPAGGTLSQVPPLTVDGTLATPLPRHLTAHKHESRQRVRRRPNGGPILGRRRRRRPSIGPPLVEDLINTGNSLHIPRSVIRGTQGSPFPAWITAPSVLKVSPVFVSWSWLINRSNVTRSRLLPIV